MNWPESCTRKNMSSKPNEDHCLQAYVVDKIFLMFSLIN